MGVRGTEKFSARNETGELSYSRLLRSIQLIVTSMETSPSSQLIALELAT